jgi:hypothetical protein
MVYISVVLEATWPTTANCGLRLGSLDFSEIVPAKFGMLFKDFFPFKGVRVLSDRTRTPRILYNV